jgi:hypothetical protein
MAKEFVKFLPRDVPVIRRARMTNSHLQLLSATTRRQYRRKRDMMPEGSQGVKEDIQNYHFILSIQCVGLSTPADHKLCMITGHTFVHSL